MHIEADGSLTIPPDVLAKAGLVPGTEVEFVKASEGIQVRQVRYPLGPDGAAEMIDRLRRARPHMTMTTDEVMRMTRGED
jgi:antitoxin component of MazEF toxin-antitoxin module